MRGSIADSDAAIGIPDVPVARRRLGSPAPPHPGETARVAYINTKNYSRLQKLTSFGVSPGVKVKLHQRKPAFVLECDQTQVAIEEAVAEEIYVFREPRG